MADYPKLMTTVDSSSLDPTVSSTSVANVHELTGLKEKEKTFYSVLSREAARSAQQSKLVVLEAVEQRGVVMLTEKATGEQSFKCLHEDCGPKKNKARCPTGEPGTKYQRLGKCEHETTLKEYLTGGESKLDSEEAKMAREFISTRVYEAPAGSRLKTFTVPTAAQLASEKDRRDKSGWCGIERDGKALVPDARSCICGPECVCVCGAKCSTCGSDWDYNKTTPPASFTLYSDDASYTIKAAGVHCSANGCAAVRPWDGDSERVLVLKDTGKSYVTSSSGFPF